MNRITKIANKIASGQGAKLTWVQIARILDANKIKYGEFDKVPLESRGLVNVSTIILPTGARLVKETHRTRGKSGYFLRVNDQDTKDWSEAFFKHVKEAGGLGGGYNIRRMV